MPDVLGAGGNALMLEGYLSRITYHLPHFKPHMDCRRVELNQALDDLGAESITWIVAEWDMGGDDFLAVIKSLSSLAGSKVFRLDMSAFEGVDDLGALRSITVDGDINKLLEQLDSVGGCYVILDDVRLGKVGINDADVIAGVKTLAESIRDFCAETKVIVRSGREFVSGGVKPIILRQLDQAECKVYVDLHPDGKNASDEDVLSGDLYDYTQGLPGRVDRVLASLEYSNFSDMANGSSDQSIEDQAEISLDAKHLIEQLKSDELEGGRLYKLLLALSVFSFGESLESIKYFYREKPFRVAMLSELIDLGLAEVVEVSEIGRKRGEFKSFVAVKRTVQAYLLRTIDEEKIPGLYEQAVAVYFGKEYKLGKYKLSASLRLRDHNLSSIAEQNASLILTRFIADVTDVDEGSGKEILERVRLLHYYVDKLDLNHKYLYLVRLCKVVIPKLVGYEDDSFVKNIKRKYAVGLRMLGRYKESISIFDELLTRKNDAEAVAAMNVSCAYSYQSLKDFTSAERYAQIVKDSKIRGASRYHAESILVMVSKDERKFGKLKRLAAKARKDKCFTSANNMEFDLVEQCEDPHVQMDLYEKIWKQAKKDGDDYNALRGVSDYCHLAMKHGRDLKGDEPMFLLEAYRFSCGQRQSGMFQRCHEALWIFFETHKSLDNLLVLFRHSSILQRLTGKDNKEKEYLFKIINLLGDGALDLGGIDEGVKRYFVARALSHNALPSKGIQKIISR